MPISTEDRLAIHELIALHGHLTDDGRHDDLDLLFAEDAVIDVTDFGLGVVEGLSALRRLWGTTAVEHPLGHHTTNVVVTEATDGTIHVRSKGLAVMPQGTTGTVIYADRVQKHARGWRITHRKIICRRRVDSPLTD